jgi:hypothetical protein
MHKTDKHEDNNVSFNFSYTCEGTVMIKKNYIEIVTNLHVFSLHNYVNMVFSMLSVYFMGACMHVFLASKQLDGFYYLINTCQQCRARNNECLFVDIDTTK